MIKENLSEKKKSLIKKKLEESWKIKKSIAWILIESNLQID